MAKIYIVTCGSYSDYSIVKVFAKKENAFNFIIDQVKSDIKEGNIDPEEFEDWSIPTYLEFENDYGNEFMDSYIETYDIE
jgi:hypothetical protein